MCATSARSIKRHRRASAPPWWSEIDGDRPVVHVTQGTIDNADLGRLLEPTIDALDGEDVIVVATTGGRDVSTLKMPVPLNTYVADYIPHDVLLPKVDVMVTNGGYGAVQRALSTGVPLVVAGNTEDKPEVAARVAWSGAGVNLRTGAPTAVRCVPRSARCSATAATWPPPELSRRRSPDATVWPRSRRSSTRSSVSTAGPQR